MVHTEMEHYISTLTNTIISTPLTNTIISIGKG